MEALLSAYRKKNAQKEVGIQYKSINIVGVQNKQISSRLT